MTRPAAGPALTWLYVPGDRPERVTKALESGADVVIVDLEDAVAPEGKERARAVVAELLSDRPPVPLHVRVNAPGSPWLAADLAALAAAGGPTAVRLPKVTGPEQVAAVAERSAGAGVYPLLESALGVEQAYAIARAHPAVRGLALGEADLRADLGVTAEEGLDWARSRVVVAARAAGLPAPVQSVYPDVRDLAGLAASCARGRALGFLGRAAIHPRQLPVIAAAYLPTASEITAAQAVLAADGGGAVALPDGRMVDPAVVALARRTLSPLP
ncbi:CoA ester lyase [Streptomyces sp. NPDC089919]|uniref:HpcH/HpaI aldolase/citrate lyase family protein n=1 Tax=Streptomyces sp. NPDC089919 TaxID=3155188 RepID=UPI00343D88DB